MMEKRHIGVYFIPHGRGEGSRKSSSPIGIQTKGLKNNNPTNKYIQ